MYHRVQDDSVTKRHPIVLVVGAVKQCKGSGLWAYSRKRVFILDILGWDLQNRSPCQGLVL